MTNKSKEKEQWVDSPMFMLSTTTKYNEQTNK